MFCNLDHGKAQKYRIDFGRSLTFYMLPVINNIKSSMPSE
jgi:hypothetical protein